MTYKPPLRIAKESVIKAGLFFPILTTLDLIVETQVGTDLHTNQETLAAAAFGSVGYAVANVLHETYRNWHHKKNQ